MKNGVGPSMTLTTSFYVIWQVISVYVKKMCGNRKSNFQKQDLQNYQVYITYCVLKIYLKIGY
ncbi:hypothetical protein Hanom_Chr17g01576271 [Helianthus anomalus]